MARPARVKLNFRLPETLRVRVEALAEREGVSINALLVQAVENYLPYREEHWGKQDRRMRQAQVERGRSLPVAQVVPKVGANQPCSCGSGLKYKRCHGRAGRVG